MVCITEVVSLDTPAPRRYPRDIEVRRHAVNNGDGWLLDVRQYLGATPSVRRPVLLVPGYCMNTTPLLFHPGGEPLVEYLVNRGFEVWTANLRGQGETRSTGGDRNVGFETLALVDLHAAIDAVRARTTTGREQLDVIGCSLGGTFLYTYLAHYPDAPFGAVVGIGAPLVWAKPHPVLRVALGAPGWLGRVRVKGTRAAARRMLPIALRFPRLLSVYMNTEHVDLTEIDRLVQTVEDPIARLNEQIARWVRSRDLTVGGVNVTEGVRSSRVPILSILANRDGIVPPSAARSVREVTDGRADVLEVGDEVTWYAHTDLFVGRTCHERVFAPLVEWLQTHSDSRP
ncbi:MAG: alpha/beta fold hydrolase [Deltaproteobacteria bacterium]